ncbi:MAG: FMN-binding negative transcriptional regulator [Burkholderiales bacterium]|nr:FMN-binding negative transcriptional regulator [Burkholderiales bacterium]
MYLPKHFAEARPEVLHAVLHEHPFAMLVTQSDAGPEVNHLPLLFDPDAGPHGTLRGHVARANRVWQAAPAGSEAIAVFQAAQHYVSPNWYPGKVADPRVVPTWNYAVVHAHGPIKVVEDEAWLHALVTALTDRQEARRPDRWRVSDAPAEYMEKMLGAIVGLEIPITRLEGKVKASQNRSAADRAGVVRGLVKEDREEASAMSRWIPQDGGPVA